VTSRCTGSGAEKAAGRPSDTIMMRTIPSVEQPVFWHRLAHLRAAEGLSAGAAARDSHRHGSGLLRHRDHRGCPITRSLVAFRVKDFPRDTGCGGHPLRPFASAGPREGLRRTRLFL
jgi:hypothetical protein